jgi:hypothetical protein
MRKDSFSFFACSDNGVRIFNKSCFFPSFTSRVTITLVLEFIKLFYKDSIFKTYYTYDSDSGDGADASRGYKGLDDISHIVFP